MRMHIYIYIHSLNSSSARVYIYLCVLCYVLLSIGVQLNVFDTACYFGLSHCKIKVAITIHYSWCEVRIEILEKFGG
jgi:hypothetical protein